jgi:tRNA-splicing ligase RtcB
MKMRPKELAKLGVPRGAAMEAAKEGIRSAGRAGRKIPDLRRALRSVVLDPGSHRDDEHFGALAGILLETAAARASFVPRESPARYRSWGEDLDPASVRQMENACRLPVSIRGALMPDAHVGYGLPIGGVLATRDAVIPYAVGVDIACRMRMSVYDLRAKEFDGQVGRLRNALERETSFGIGAVFRKRRDHEVMDEDWSVSPVTRRLKDKAWSQLGTSGSGNHFVEYGILSVDDDRLGIPPGRYVALLSHSGSRGVGAEVAGHYSRLAMERRRELPDELRHLAWLDLGSEEGREYWAAMELMGKYAAANHACIHRHIARGIGHRPILALENHHNFAWREEHDGEGVVVHRKGATPAGTGDLGIIPGTMASPAFVVRGKGNPDSLRSAAHGAGRRMSRKAAIATYSWKDLRWFLEQRGVTLLSAGLDEVPMAYKNIEEVMDAQSDLVETLARFDPKLVKMAPPGERAED